MEPDTHSPPRCRRGWARLSRDIRAVPGSTISRDISRLTRVPWLEAAPLHPAGNGVAGDGGDSALPLRPRIPNAKSLSLCVRRRRAAEQDLERRSADDRAIEFRHEAARAACAVRQCGAASDAEHMRAGCNKRGAASSDAAPRYTARCFVVVVHRMAREGIEPPTRGFSVRCSTN